MIQHFLFVCMGSVDTPGRTCTMFIGRFIGHTSQLSFLLPIDQDSLVFNKNGHIIVFLGKASYPIFMSPLCKVDLTHTLEKF